ncbi:MAG: glycosyltransferase family 4 protein [Rhodobiaceae bacterium]|nr:glycosyltransferase family 4 protein [Rhodobiaceae bacterium]MCC0055233.1 glycosyltransferase family 4 protein [Rhodobiaceae bacterium]
MQEAILHIGLPKTASTYLQRWLALNREALEHIGLGVDSSRGFGHQIRIEFDEFVSNGMELPNDGIDIRGLLGNEGRTIPVISSESFWHRDPEQIQRYFAYKQLRISKVVFFLRRQDRMEAAQYAQHVKGDGWATTFEQGDERLNYLALWQSWARCFGSDRVAVLDYDACDNMNKVEHAFMDSIGFPRLKDPSVPDRALVTNPTPDAALVEIIRLNNLRGHAVVQQPMLRDIIGKMSAAAPFGIEQEIVSEIEATWIDINRELVDRLGGKGFEALTTAGWRSAGIDLAGKDVTARLVELISIVAELTEKVAMPSLNAEIMRPYRFQAYPSHDISSNSRADEIVAITRGSAEALRLLFARATDAGVFETGQSRADATPKVRTGPTVARTTFNELIDLAAFAMHLLEARHRLRKRERDGIDKASESATFATTRTEKKRKPLILRPDLMAKKAFYRTRYFYLDPDYYLATNPDVAAVGMDPYIHYGRTGIREGRRPRRDSSYEKFERDISPPVPRFLPQIDPRRSTVLVVLHEGSRTGAPLIGYNLVLYLLKRYNVVVVALENGPIVRACAKAGAQIIAPEKGRIRSWLIAGELVDKAIKSAAISFALVNSVDSRFVQRRLREKKIPTVLLVHEFASYIRPLEEFCEALDRADQIVFPSRIVAENAEALHPELSSEKYQIRAQGLCRLPEDVQSAANGRRPNAIEKDEQVRSLLGLENSDQDRVTIVGIGAVNQRKGVDLFIQCAAHYFAGNPDDNVRFVWVGGGHRPDVDGGFSASIADQITRSKLEGRVTFAGEIKNMDAVYRNADILALTSRLDPMPNVAIEAFCAAIPVVCFARAAGTGETLEDAGVAPLCIAEYLNTHDMAAKIAALVHSPSLKSEVGETLRRHVEGKFDFDDYATFVEELALAAGADRQAEGQVG